MPRLISKRTLKEAVQVLTEDIPEGMELDHGSISRWLRVKPRTVSRWASGETESGAEGDIVRRLADLKDSPAWPRICWYLRTKIRGQTFGQTFSEVLYDLLKRQDDLAALQERAAYLEAKLRERLSETATRTEA